MGPPERTASIEMETDVGDGVGSDGSRWRIGLRRRWGSPEGTTTIVIGTARYEALVGASAICWAI
jgi:hypothetical protein